jgi:putative DNA primase/helicase
MVSTFYDGNHSGANNSAAPEFHGHPERLNRQQQNDLLVWARAWQDAGCAVHPSKIDGSKYAIAVRHGSPDIQPDTFPATYQSGKLAGMPHPRAGQTNPEAGQHGYGWGRIKDGQLPPLTLDQIGAYVRGGKSDGIGIICGTVSGGVFMLEAEGRARDLLGKVKEAAEQQGCLPLLERLAAGCVDESPSGGLHFYGRSADGVGPGNTVLAARPDADAEHGRQVLFETRGQGGWSVVAPSAGRTHKTGKPYQFVRGGPSTIPTFSPEEIQQLFNVFRAVDEMPAPEPFTAAPANVQRRERPAGDILPGDDFNQRVSWEEILTGWKPGQVVGDRRHWSRPGKEHGTSATTTADVLCCFSSSAGLPVFDSSSKKNALSKFATYAHLNHGGDFTAAARSLWHQGYGSRADDSGDNDGGQPVVVDPRPAPQGPQRTLDDWRQEAAARRVESVTTPGLWSLDRSPTGAGKSFATNQALRLASSSLTVLPTHTLCREQVEALRAEGVDAVAYPELTADNCQRFDEASRAQRLGLVAGAAVCPTCPFNRIPNPKYPGKREDGKPETKTIPGPCHDADQYHGLMQAAHDSPRRFATQERLRRSSTCAEGMQVVVIDEQPEAVLAPTLTVSTRDITAVETLANAIRHHWYSEATQDQKSFAAALLNVVASIHATCAEITTAGTKQVSLTMGHEVPKNWQRLLFESIRQVGVSDTLEPDALSLVTKAAAGDLLTLEIVTDLTKTGRLMHFVVGSWRPHLPADAAVVMTDATGDVHDIMAVVGRKVVDCTPTGHLPLMHPVVQIPDDISRTTASSTVAGYVEAFLTANPNIQRLGIIGHSKHIHDLIDGGMLSESARARVVKWTYFGAGDDRGSNGWHSTCQQLLRLGSPRANPGDYRRWLVQHGLHEAAGKVDGDWGRRDWEATTVDGRTVTVPGVGYRDPDWHRAYTAISRAAGRQVDGRGRSMLPDGIPVTIMSNEPGPYPIVPSLNTTPKTVRETAQIVRDLARRHPGTLLGQSAKNPIGIPYRENCAFDPVPTADCITAIITAAGCGRRAAQVRLTDCIRAGLLTKLQHGWYAVPESSPAGDCTPCKSAIARGNSVSDPTKQAAKSPPVQPAPTPPAILLPPVQSVVIAAVGPSADAPAVDVVAESTPGTTTATCTSTVQPSAAGSVDDLLALIDERAAIVEFDGGYDRATAERLAREMVMGRDAPSMPADDIVASVDTLGLAARSNPYVHQVLKQIAGTVQLLDDKSDPFARRRRGPTKRRPGQCSCGHDDRWVQVSIHGGQSVRVDCGHCDRFGWFAVWYGKQRPAPGAARQVQPDHDAVQLLPPLPVPSVDQVLVPA